MNPFEYNYKPTDAQLNRMTKVREGCANLWDVIEANLPKIPGKRDALFSKLLDLMTSVNYEVSHNPTPEDEALKAANSDIGCTVHINAPTTDSLSAHVIRKAH